MNVVVAMLSAAVLLTATSAGTDREVVSIRIWPATSFEPSDVMVQVDVEENADNRLLQVSADSGQFYWSSERQLEGENGPRLSDFACRQVPAGEYDVRAQVLGASGQIRSSARGRMVVLPR